MWTVYESLVLDRVTVCTVVLGLRLYDIRIIMVRTRTEVILAVGPAAGVRGFSLCRPQAPLRCVTVGPDEIFVWLSEWLRIWLRVFELCLSRQTSRNFFYSIDPRVIHDCDRDSRIFHTKSHFSTLFHTFVNLGSCVDHYKPVREI